MRGDSLRGNSRGCRWFAHSKTVARRLGSSCEKRLFIAFFRSWHTDDVVWRPFHPWDGWKMEKYGEGRAEESLLPVPRWPSWTELSNRVAGALGEFGDFFVGDQLVLYINDRGARIIHRDFFVRTHLPRANLSVKLIALTWVKGTLEKDAAEKER